MRGWLGGACAEPAVVREALRALDQDSPRLLFLGQPEELEGYARDGVVTVPVAENVARYRIGFRGDDGRVIAHVDRRQQGAVADAVTRTSAGI